MQPATVATILDKARQLPAGQEAPALPSAHADAKVEAATGKAHDKAFSSVLASTAKEGAKSLQPEGSLTKPDGAMTKAVTQQSMDIAAQAMDKLLESTAVAAQAVVPGVAAPAAQAVQAAIAAPVNSEKWGDEFNQQITWMATQHEQVAELHLNPPNLGPLDVVLNVSGDQATALFTSPHAAVRDAVEQALPKLRDMLADNGITLGNAMVSDQSPKDQQAWQAGQQQRNGRGGGEVDAITGSLPTETTAALVQRHRGLVDTFA
jgi:flagellar hook-length control protein FliK